MSDTYSTTTVVTEDHDMGKVKEIFDRALNALVDASSLAKTVDQLKTDLDSLKVQVTHYRNTIANQDDQITRLRQDRDAARTAQYHAEDTARHLTTEVETVKRDNDSLSAANVRLNDRISELTKERDDAQFKLLELQEAHNSLSEKMEKVRAMLGLPKEPEVVPVVPAVQEPEPHAWMEPSPPLPPLQEGTPVTEPEPPVNPPEPSPSEWPKDIR